GIYVWAAQDIRIFCLVIANNTCVKNYGHGIWLRYVDSNSISWNVLEGNQGYGICLSSVSGIVWHNQTFTYFCENNIIHHNFLLNNNNGLIQAYDNGTTNHWFDASSYEGNYWSDYIGIGNYSIDGPIGVEDPYPLDLDLDNDGMLHCWEVQNGLDPLVDDALGDFDQDGLTNIEELTLNLRANQNDTDRDGMSDGWEYHMGLNPRVDDASLDRDDDGMLNLWEYQMNLNATLDDAADDRDADGMPNFWEFQMNLNAMLDDSAGDLDEDGMPNLWEYNHDFNATNPADAKKDADGDWVKNVVEYKAGTDPRDFWSVPLDTLSVLHIGATLLILLLLVFSGVSYLRLREKQHQILVARLNAPDYPTAAKIRKAGFSDYSAFLQAKTNAKLTVEQGISLYLQGEYLKASQQYEQALVMYRLLEDKNVIAETLFRVVSIEVKLLGSIRSNLLHHLPNPPYEDPSTEAFIHMIQALVAETNKNWGAAEKEWRTAMKNTKIDFKYQMVCQGALMEAEVRNWLSNTTQPTQDDLLSRLDEWQQICETKQFLDSVCQAYLLRVRIALANYQFDEAETLLDRSLKTAEEAGLNFYQELIQKEITVFLQHKKRILDIIDKEKGLTVEEQQKSLRKYIQGALLALEKAGLREED
ncbi:MAG: NosD domain-containing protein, partial [Promethearchaeota archaeon]